MSRVFHLARRFVGSLSRRPPSAVEVEWALAHLRDEEAVLWGAMPVADRRHSLVVARRFVDLRPSASEPEIAAALLHDVGKTDCGLGTLGRVVATVIGPRGARMRAYHEHEEIGARMLLGIGSDPATVDLVRGAGPAAGALRAADDV